MIYKNNPCIKLFGEEADIFLAESGITLYEDCIVLEGEQAEAYKARKEAEEKSKWKKEHDRQNGPRSTDTTSGPNTREYNNAKNSRSREEFEAKQRSAEKVRDEADRRWKAAWDHRNDDKDYNHNYENLQYHGQRSDAADAIRRHERRHPKTYKESSIFDNLKFI